MGRRCVRAAGPVPDAFGQRGRGRGREPPVTAVTYDDLVRAQVEEAKASIGGRASDQDLAGLLAGNGLRLSLLGVGEPDAKFNPDASGTTKCCLRRAW